MSKKGKLHFNRRSVLLTWCLSYLAVLLLPICMSVIVYMQSSRTLVDEIHQANDSLLKQLREQMDSQFQSMERLDFELTWNTKVREIIDFNKYRIFPQDYSYDLYHVTNDLNLYKSSYSMIDLFYVYMAARDTVILPNVYRDSAFAYQVMHQGASFSYKDWLTIVQQAKQKGFLPMARINESGSLVKTVAYVSTYPAQGGTSAGANVIMIDQSRILGAINNMELFSKGHVLILNEENQVLVSNSNEALPASFPFERLGGSSGLLMWENGGQRFEVFHIQSNVSKLKYVSMVPSDLYWEKAELVRSLTYMSILISLLGGALLTYIFLRKNYNPVRRLVDAVTRKSAAKREQGYNEFHFIQEAVDLTLSEMDDMLVQMKRQHHTLRSNFVTRLLKGKLDSDIPVNEAITTFHMQFESDHFAVILLYAEDSELFMERIQGKDADGKLRLLNFIVTNVVEELANVQHHGYVADMDDALACLISFSDRDLTDRTEALLQLAREAQAFLMSQYSIHLTVSISGVHSGLKGISEAYMEALYAMEYKLVMGKQEILLYEDIQQYNTRAETDPGYYYPLQVEQQLMNFVKIGDFEQAKKTLEEIIEQNFGRHSISVVVARCLMLDLVSTLIKTIGEIGDTQENFLIQNPKLIERLTACETLQAMQSQMTELLAEVCAYTSAKRQHNVQQTRQRALDELICEVTRYIEEHFKDPVINVSSIGHYFEMKPTYLSKLYKDHTGEGLLDALNGKRIAEAKRLIGERGLTVADVAESIGFNDVGTFIRTFKKLEGITPGKYKEMMEE